MQRHLGIVRYPGILTFATAFVALAGCAGRLIAHTRLTERSPVPEWLSDVVGCDRAQLDREWSLRRYVPILTNDTACVALGRFGEPREATITHDAGVGTILSLDWQGLVAARGTHVIADRGEPTGKTTWPTSYFQIWSWGPPPRAKVDTSHTAAIVGTVVDSLGMPLGRNLYVCAFDEPSGAKAGARRCTTTTPSGSYRLDSLPPRWVRIEVTCAGPTILASRLLLNTSQMPARPIGPAQVALVSFRGCDSRPVRTVHGRFAGHWSRGFEENAFVPCARSSWRIPSDSLSPKAPGRAAAWVVSLPRYKSPQWPARLSDGSPNGSGGYVSYVEWTGTITGPSHYGHMGISDWAMRVDSVIVMRNPSRKDCTETQTSRRSR